MRGAAKVCFIHSLLQRESVRSTLLFFIGNFIPYKANPSVGSHCGGMEQCRRYDPPQEENLAYKMIYLIGEAGEKWMRIVLVFFLVDGGFYRKSWIFPFESIRICCTMKYKRLSFSCLNDFSLMTVMRGMSIV